MKKEKIEMKNYVIFGFVCVVSVFLVWYCASWYRTTEEYRVETSPIVEMISEIHMDEVSNYILDNGNITIYVTSFAAEVKFSAAASECPGCVSSSLRINNLPLMAATTISLSKKPSMSSNRDSSRSSAYKKAER